jgi:hypothetical protein
MKKTTILMFTVLLVLMGSIAYAEQKQRIDQTKLSAEEQIEYLDNSIKTYDGILKDMDSIIDTYQKQKTSIVEQRAKLNVYKEALIYSNRKQLKERGWGEAAISGAAAVGSAATGNYVGAAVSGSAAVNSGLDAAIKHVENQNAAIEKTLAGQRDWKASHPGRR